MRVEHKEPAKGFPADCELRLGTSSWDPEARSIKFAWRDRNGKVSRGGEVPVEALPQMLEIAVRHGYLNLRSV